MKRWLCSITFLWVALLALLPAQAAAQRTPTPPSSETERQRRAEENKRRESFNSLDNMGREHRTILRGAAEDQTRSSFYEKKLTPEQKRLLEPAPAEQAAYREFLRQGQAGLFRLLPRGKYELRETVDADTPDMVLPIRGGGAFYSFAEKKHSYGPWSEITFQEGRLIAGFAHQSLGLMTMLGDVPLETVSLATPGADYLARLMPPTQWTVARDQHRRNVHGFAINGHTYTANVPAAVNQTYVLRSIVYKKEGRMQTIPGGGAVYVPHPYEYIGTDELVAFRILSTGDDGSLTILWKRLQKLSPPRIKAPDAAAAAPQGKRQETKSQWEE